MDILNLKRFFEIACELYSKPVLMYAHGVRKLEAIFDLQASTNRTQFLRP
jgi:hypothetical protein